MGCRLLFDCVGSCALVLLVVVVGLAAVVVVLVRLDAGFAFVVEWEGG